MHITASGALPTNQLHEASLNCDVRLQKVWGFNSERKQSSIALRMTHGSGTAGPVTPVFTRVFTKGAAEWLLPHCSHYVPGQHAHGADAAAAAPQAPLEHRLHVDAVRIEPPMRAALDQAVERMAAQGLRVICLAMRDMAPSDADHPSR